MAPNDVTIHQYPNIPDYSKEDDVVLIFPSPSSVTIANIFCGHSNFIVKENFGLPKGQHMGTLLRFKLNDIVSNDVDIDDITLPQVNYDLTNLPIKRAVFIDSTWNQSRSIFKDKRISCLKSIVLQNRASQFWRHQKGSPRWYLATIEAIHQFLFEVHVHAWGLDSNYFNVLKTIEIMSDFIPESKILNYENKTDENTLCNVPYNGQYDDLLYFFAHMYDLIHVYYSHDKLKSYKRPF